MSSAWSQLDQLLTCAICLDRYRNPKLLPCQHTFCQEPCLEGLVDYARRQIKCPECRAEHRIPYQGVQSFAVNVTLMRFLELHRDITGEEPEPPPSMMERCGVCSEKSYLTRCAHCDKKICQDCKEAHVDILRREINRINGQVKRGLHRLSDALSQTQKNAQKLQQNCNQVREEIEELVKRYTKDIKDSEERMKQDVDMYIQKEMKTINKLKDDLEVEVENLSSNCELVEKHVNGNNDGWTDAELVEYKEIFLRTLEFIRNFDADSSDYARRIKFTPKADPDALHRTLSDFGEIKINLPPAALQNCVQANSPSNALMRSQSDHRLAAQFQRRQQENKSFLDVSQRFGGHTSDSERDSKEAGGYGRNRDYRRFGERSNQDHGEGPPPRSRFLRDDSSRWRDNEGETGSYRSRYGREEESDFDVHHSRTVRFEEPSPAQNNRQKLFESEEASKGPLSGLIRLADSPYLMERLHQNEVRQQQQTKENERKTTEPQPPPAVAPSVPPPTSTYVPQPPPRRQTSRQTSEDEIEKQKKQNQAAAALPTRSASPPPVTATPTSHETPPTRPILRRVSTLQKEDEVSRRPSRQDNQSPDMEAVSSRQENTEEETPRSWRRSSVVDPDATTNDSQPPQSPLNRSLRPSLGKSLSLERPEEPSTRPPSFTKPPDKKKEEERPIQSSFYGRVLGLSTSHAPTKTEEEEENDEDEEESEEDTDSEVSTTTDSESDDKTPPAQPLTANSSKSILRSLPSNESTISYSHTPVSREVNGYSEPIRKIEGASTDYVYRTRNPEYRRKDSDQLSNYSFSSRDDSRYSSRDDCNRRSLGDTSLRNEFDTKNLGKKEYDTSTRRSSLVTKDEIATRSWRDRKEEYSIPSRYRPKPSNGEDDNEDSTSAYRRYLSRSRSSALLASSRDPSPEPRTPRRTPVTRSKSSHTLGLPDDSPDDEFSYTRYDRNARRKGRDQSPEETPVSENVWAKYLKNKYGGASTNGSSRAVSRSRSSHALYSHSGSEHSSDDEALGSRKGSLTTRYNDQYGFISPKNVYMQKKKPILKIGNRGSDPGCFTWPRGVAVGPDNSIVVADTQNHRVQLFDSGGRLRQVFGSYGSGPGEFDGLAGVAVNRIGQIIVSDRYNNRLQVFDPTGRFLRAFGSEGRTDGRLNLPWGLATDSLGFIYVCDKDNHRIQVFQSDGTFVGKFGGLGSRAGQLDHPHFVAVSSANRVVVADSDNHRLQVFDVNGRSLATFGTEGSAEGQLKFPRGVAVDDQGYIIVGDSGNNRVQIFQPDGTFLRAFGTWGKAEGEFKGLEGIAVMTNGNILVCDRENHRIQVF